MNLAKCSYGSPIPSFRFQQYVSRGVWLVVNLCKIRRIIG
jgi:hypothetical protein